MTTKLDTATLTAMSDERLADIEAMFDRIQPAAELTFSNIHTEQRKADIRNSPAVHVAAELLSEVHRLRALLSGESK